jgi:long-chain fatty acid transport protein
MSRRGAAVLALLLLVTPGDLKAAITGNIFSGPTTGDGASIYQNPAAMTLLHGTHGLAFGAVSAIRLHYQRDTVSAFDGSPFPQADVFVAKPNLAVGVVTDATLRNLRFGIGVALPIIEGATWDKEYDGRPSSTRYYALAARLAFFKIEPAVAWRINEYISIGVGMDIVGAMLSHNVMTDFGAKINHMTCAMNPQARCPLDAPLAREDPAFDAPTKLDGLGWGVGVIAGLLVSPTPWLRIGGGFHSGAGDVKVPVELSVELPSVVTDYISANLPSVTLPPLEAEAEVTTVSPMIATAGIAVDPTPKLEIAFDLHWIDFSSTPVMVGVVRKGDELGLIHDQVLIKDRDDAFLFGLRGAYQILPSLRAALRFEFETNSRPEEFMSPVSVDFNKFSLHAGAAWQVTRNIALTLEYGHYFLPDRKIEHSRFAPNAQPTTPEEEGFDKPSATGDYFIEVDRFGLGIMLGF